MKRAGNLWDQITSWDNLMLAHKQARKGKAFYTEVKMVDADPEYFINIIQHSLISKQFSTSKYEIEDRFDGRKMRTIYKLPYFPDRIIQHALLNVIGPILVNGFIRDTFQSIAGRGTSDAAKRIKTLIRSDDPPKYALKMDIKKYYPSVDNEILKAEVRRKIKCHDTLWLIDDIIDSIQGLPIGNYTSQHLGNLYLSRFDWWVKQEIKPRGYFRYCDDLVFLDDTSKKLVDIKRKAELRLCDLGLSVKPNWNISSIPKNGVDFVGYVFYPTHTRLRNSIAKRFKSSCRRLTRASDLPDNARSTLMAYKGWVLRSSSKRLWRSNITPPLRRAFPKQLRGAV
jgi:RNA-directed DNA polymerase